MEREEGKKKKLRDLGERHIAPLAHELQLSPHAVLLQKFED